MPIPFILGALSAGAAIIGALQAKSGMDKLKKAQEIADNAHDKYQKSLEELKTYKDEVNRVYSDYVSLHSRISSSTVNRFIKLINKISQQEKTNNTKILDGLNISSKQFTEYQQTVIKTNEVLSGIGTATIAGIATSQGTVAIAALIGTASTGTAISSLGGAAAANATLAWLGGGSLATGGGGMAMGSIVLGGITLGSSVMIGGLMISGKGDEALLKSQKYESEISEAIKAILKMKIFLKEVIHIINLLTHLSNHLEGKLIKTLDEVEKIEFKREKYNNSLKWASILIKTIEKIRKTPIIDRQGNINSQIKILLLPNLASKVKKEEEFKNLIKKAIMPGVILIITSVAGITYWNLNNKNSSVFVPRHLIDFIKKK